MNTNILFERNPFGSDVRISSVTVHSLVFHLGNLEVTERLKLRVPEHCVNRLTKICSLLIKKDQKFAWNFALEILMDTYCGHMPRENGSLEAWHRDFIERMRHSLRTIYIMLCERRGKIFRRRSGAVQSLLSIVQVCW